MFALLSRFCVGGGALSRFLAAATFAGFAAVGFAASAFAQSPPNFQASVTGNNAVALSWVESDPAPNQYVVSYGGEVTLSGVEYGGAGSITVNGNAAGQYTATASGLASYVPYRFTLIARTFQLVGSNITSIDNNIATAAATPVSPPEAPLVSAVVAGAGSISFSLIKQGLAPVENFAVRIVNADYLSAWQRGVTTAATLSANFVVTPLFDLYSPSSGEAYTIIARANNAAVSGVAATITINPLFGAPAAPDRITAAPLPGAASLRWHFNWNHGGGGFINAYIVSWSSGDQSGIVGGSAISGGATIDAAGNIANDASVLSSLVPANRQLSVAGWRSAVVPMPGNAPCYRCHSRPFAQPLFAAKPATGARQSALLSQLLRRFR